MGLLENIVNRVLGTKTKSKASQQEKQSLLRRCYFEVMEQRRVLSANPVIAGMTYLEGDAGQDTTPDHFEVTFEGGASTTQMTQFTVNGDQDFSGSLSVGDMFFDVNDQLPGAGGYHGFEFDAANSSGLSASDIRSIFVSSDGLTLTVNVDNFDAGDKLAFTIDVDEVERYRADKIASGVEFEGSLFDAKFVDENYTFEDKSVVVNVPLEDGFVQSQREGIFFDEYDQLIGEGERIANSDISLMLDNEEGSGDRTAGAINAYDLVPKPVSISGTIYHDENCDHVTDEVGIEGVEVQLQRFNESTGIYESVATTNTNADGDYEFGKDLNLKPGKFKLVEVQPDGFLDVGAEAGSHGGVVTDAFDGNENVIVDINIPFGGTAATDYDFQEVKPATISGHVWHDENNDGVFNSSEQGIANVLIQITRVGVNDGVATDPFASFAPMVVRTDASGFYEVDALPPGIYDVVEINDYPSLEVDPLAAYIDGKDSTGTIDGATVGVKENDRFSQIVLCAGDAGIHYDFGEVLPAEISGIVWHDSNDNGVIESGEDRLGGVVIELLDKQGHAIAETTTDPQGNYSFNDLYPGEYVVKEIQPLGLLDGQDSLGQIGGLTAGEMSNDEFYVNLEAGDMGVQYNFGELRPSSISGTVHGDANGDCVFDPSQGDIPLEGVELVLLDNNGDELARTLTDQNGDYSFENLRPGTYSVREVTPNGYLDGAEMVGQVSGLIIGEVGQDLISGIRVDSGETAVNYDFCEHIPTQLCGTVFHDRNNNGVQDSNEEGIEGTRIVLTDADGNVIAETFTDSDGDYCFKDLIAGTYRVKEFQPEGFVDGQDSVGFVAGVRNGDLANDNVFNIRLVGNQAGNEYNFGELQLAEISGLVHLDQNGNCVFEASAGEKPLANVTLELLNAKDEVVAITQTDANGEYLFGMILPGVYSIRQTQPEGLISGGESAGNGGGSAAENMIQGIVISSGQQLSHYDFCEVNVVSDPGLPAVPPLIPPPVPLRPSPIGNPLPPSPGIAGLSGLAGSQQIPSTQEIGLLSGRASTQAVAAAYSWHLSVVNAGLPRGAEDGSEGNSIWQQAGFISNADWRRFDMDDAVWSFTETSEVEFEITETSASLRFGMLGGTPLAGDFDGDGTDEVAVFKDGYWMIDLNRNGRWDETDLLARLGDTDDRPVVGDWDGDGKDDIGIYGPIWARDHEAIARDPGLPNPDNNPYTRPKNVPPVDAEATHGARTMKLTSFGRQRADVVDHVFGLGAGREIPVTGDWNGNGIRSIGTFVDGIWKLDVNGDGRFDHQDATVQFGRIGDLPVVGDFNGDGIAEIAVYRSGTWMIDVNGNRELDATDKTFEMGGALDKPIVGDWDGDGIDEPGLYTEQSNNSVFE